MSTSTLAIPSALPGGLEAGMGMHFGHCDIYTIVQIEDGAIKSVGTLPNVPHQQGGCLAPVQHLASHGVTALLAGGMGMRPLMGFQQAGVSVYYAGNYPTVGLAVQAFLDGKLPAFSTEFTCGGGNHSGIGNWWGCGRTFPEKGSPAPPPNLPPTLSKDFRAYRIPVRSFPGNRRREDPLYHYCCIV